MAAHRHHGQPGGRCARSRGRATRWWPVANRMPAWHELGGAAANAGVQIHEIGHAGVFSADELRAAAKPRNFPIFPTTTLVEIENTHNRAGGVVVPQAEVLRICAVARELGLATFLDGARLWNASAASGVALHELAAPFDLVAGGLQQGVRGAGRLAAGGIEGADRRGASPPPAHGRRDAAKRHLRRCRAVCAGSSPAAPARRPCQRACVRRAC